MLKNNQFFFLFIYQILSLMDIQQLSPQQLELTLRLSDLLSMEDLTVAAAVLSSFDWNIQNALKELQNIEEPPPPPPAKKVEIPKYPQGIEIDPNPYNYEVDEDEQDYVYEESNLEYENKLIDEKKKYFQEQHASLFSLKKTVSEQGNQLKSLQYHKHLASDSKAHRQDYLIAIMNKSQILCKKIIQSSQQNKTRYNENKRRIQNNRKFINSLFKTYHPKINFTFGTFFLNLTRSYLQGKYLLVYIHSVAPETEKSFKSILQLILKQQKIANVVNKNCISYGMFDNSDDYQILQKYIPLKSLPAFGLFKLSKTKKSEEFISAYNLSQKQLFLEWLSHNMGVSLSQQELQGEHIDKQKVLKEQYSRKQIQTKKNAQIIEQNMKKQLQYFSYSNEIAAQDELYKQMQKTYLQKRQLSQDEKDRLQQNEQSLKKRIQEASKQIQPQPASNVIQIKFRMPITGQSRARRFLFTDKIQKCFNFVDCFCRDEFQEQFSDFDIMQTHPMLILSNFKQKTFEEIFEGSRRQNVIVRQKS